MISLQVSYNPDSITTFFRESYYSVKYSRHINCHCELLLYLPTRLVNEMSERELYGLKTS